MKGKVYEIFNEETQAYYIGSTRQEYPRRRLYRHRQDCMLGQERYYPLFDCVDMAPTFKIIDTDEYETIYQLREKENYYLNKYRQEGKTCTNKNMAFVPEHLKATALKVAKQKYMKTEKGKAKKKIWNKAYNQRRKLKSAHLKNAKSNEKT